MHGMQGIQNTRRSLQISIFAILLFASISDSIAITKEIPESKSLKNEISFALQKTEPLVVLVSLDNCAFCKIARENYLIPMMAEQHIPVVQVNFRHSTLMLDWNGKPTTHDQLVRFLGIKIAPTILFMGKDGTEVAPRLVGGSSSDFYGTFLEDRIRIARLAIAK